MARRTPPRRERGRNQMDVYWPRATGTTARDIIASSRVRMERRCGLPSMRRRTVRGRVMIVGIRWCSRWGVIVMGHQTLGRRRHGRRCLRSRVLSSHSEVPKLRLAGVYRWVGQLSWWRVGPLLLCRYHVGLLKKRVATHESVVATYIHMEISLPTPPRTIRSKYSQKSATSSRVQPIG